MRRVHYGQIRGPRNVHKPLNLFLIFLELIVDGLFNLNLKGVYNTLNPLIPYHGPHPNQLILLKHFRNRNFLVDNLIHLLHRQQDQVLLNFIIFNPVAPQWR